MKQDDLHVKQDEWGYPAASSTSRGKIKRSRAKAKRRLSKQLIKKALTEEQ